MAADDVGDHVGHLRVLDAAGLLHGGKLILQARPKLAGDAALLLEQLGAGAPFLDLLGDALIAGGQLLGVLGHQLADLLGTVLRARPVRHQQRSSQSETASKPDQHQILSV